MIDHSIFKFPLKLSFDHVVNLNEDKMGELLAKFYSLFFFMIFEFLIFLQVCG